MKMTTKTRLMPYNDPFRVYRGGSWGLRARYVRVGLRATFDPGYHFNDRCFRAFVLQVNL